MDGHDRQQHPVAALGLAAVLSGANPKHLLLAVGAAAIAQTGIPGGQQAIAYLVFALIGTLGVGMLGSRTGALACARRFTGGGCCGCG